MGTRKRIGVALFLWAAASAPGEAQTAGKLVYTSINPCRVVDTRPSGPGALSAGVPRAFHVVGNSSNFAGQGGTAGGCGIPGFAGATPQVAAVAFNLVAVNPSGAGNLRVWASDQPVPNASALNYAAVTGLNIANAVIVPVRQDVEGDDVTARADVSGTHLVVDVVGYFAPLAIVAGDLPVVPINRGGTGSTVQSFVDLSTSQTVGGDKTFSGDVNVGGDGSVTGGLAVGSGSLSLTDGVSNTVFFGSAGLSPPTSPLGWKLRTFGSSHGLGVDGPGQWYSSLVDHRWYTAGGATLAMNLDGTGLLTVQGVTTGPVAAGAVTATGPVAGSGFRQPGTGGELLKMIRGNVNAAGGASAGTGFTALRVGTGVYQVGFDTAFTNVPTVMLTLNNQDRFGQLLNVQPGFFLAILSSAPGILTDADFGFLAVGPP